MKLNQSINKATLIITGLIEQGFERRREDIYIQSNPGYQIWFLFQKSGFTIKFYIEGSDVHHPDSSVGAAAILEADQILSWLAKSKADFETEFSNLLAPYYVIIEESETVVTGYKPN